jgi:DNA transformation protein
MPPAARPEFVDYLADVFAPLGTIEVSRLFGGWLFKADGRAFGVVLGGTLYYRPGPSLRPALEAAGSRPFSYRKRTGQVTISRFMSAPEEDLEDEDALRGWAMRVLAEAP